MRLSTRSSVDFPPLAVEKLEIADRDLPGQACRVDAGVRRHRSGDAGRVVRGCHAHDDFLVAVRERAMMLSASTVTVIRSAPVQASFCHSSQGDRANWKMTTGRLGNGWVPLRV